MQCSCVPSFVSCGHAGYGINGGVCLMRYAVQRIDSSTNRASKRSAWNCLFLIHYTIRLFLYIQLILHRTTGIDIRKKGTHRAIAESPNHALLPLAGPSCQLPHRSIDDGRSKEPVGRTTWRQPIHRNAAKRRELTGFVERKLECCWRESSRGEWSPHYSFLPFLREHFLLHQSILHHTSPYSVTYSPSRDLTRRRRLELVPA